MRPIVTSFVASLFLSAAAVTILPSVTLTAETYQAAVSR